MSNIIIDFEAWPFEWFIGMMTIWLIEPNNTLTSSLIVVSSRALCAHTLMHASDEWSDMHAVMLDARALHDVHASRSSIVNYLI